MKNNLNKESLCSKYTQPSNPHQDESLSLTHSTSPSPLDVPTPTHHIGKSPMKSSSSHPSNYMPHTHIPKPKNKKL